MLGPRKSMSAPMGRITCQTTLDAHSQARPKPNLTKRHEDMKDTDSEKGKGSKGPSLRSRAQASADGSAEGMEEGDNEES